jgi:uncharacterized short protein YbdD (DUF466 family)
MICRCFGRNLDVSTLLKRAGETAHLMVGVPDYDAYVAHVRVTHPERVPMERDAFFRERQAARYGGAGRGGFRCC